MRSKRFFDWKLPAWLILALIIVLCMVAMYVLAVTDAIIPMILRQMPIYEGLFYVVIILATSIGGIWMLRVLGVQMASMLVVSKDKIVWKNPGARSVKLRIDECKYVGMSDCIELPRASRAPPVSIFLRRGDELSLIYISDHPMPIEYYHKLSADKCKDGFICFVYSDKLCKALIEVLPEEKTAVLKAFYERMQEADIRLAKEKEKYKKKKLREKEKEKKLKEKKLREKEKEKKRKEKYGIKIKHTNMENSMIVFEGPMSGECRKYLLRRNAKISFIGGLITSIIFIIPTVILALKVDLILLFFLFVLIPFPFLVALRPREIYYPIIFPSKITIDTQTREMTIQSSQFCAESSIDEVVKVMDKGEWYLICVESNDRQFVCQKDLLTNGTLDEFEEIFRDKIIK